MKPEERLIELFNLAKLQGRIKTQGEFAEMLGTTQATISHAMKGDGLVSSANWMRKAEEVMRAEGLHVSISQSNGGGVNTQQNFLPSSEPPVGGDVNAIVDKLVNEMAAQRQTYEKIIEKALDLAKKP